MAVIFDERRLRELVADALREVLREQGAPRPAVEYLSIADAARIAAVAPATIRAWIAAGHLGPARRAGRELRVDRSELERFMSGPHGRTPTPSPEQVASEIFERRRRKRGR